MSKGEDNMKWDTKDKHAMVELGIYCRSFIKMEDLDSEGKNK
jgi:hypothetical protein